jgi:excinuclease ABC subunit C
LLAIAEANAKDHFKQKMAKSMKQQRGLELIQEKLGLPELPRRIECYDISNFQGEDSVGSQVVFEDGLPQRNHYRHYRIKTVQGANDFASMKEVVSRRFKHREWEEPQLIVVDGGKGQLGVFVEVLKEYGLEHIPVVGLAKARTQGHFSESEVKGTLERFFLPQRQNPVTFPSNSEALQILVGIRDEAHRFALNYHRKLRNQSLFESELDLVVGLGEKRKKQLLRAFGSVEGVRMATVDEIEKLRGFHRILAERILLQLKDLDEEAAESERFN